MKSVKSLPLTPVWLLSSHIVESARILMAGHKISVLPIQNEDGSYGYVTERTLAVAKGSDPLQRFIEPFSISIAGESDIRQAASIFVQNDISVAPVITENQFGGLLTSQMLLKELARSWDSLTGLAWVDDVRTWGTEQLRQGRELSLILFDVVSMSTLNQKHGFEAGDRVLQNIASELLLTIDPSREVVVRNNGDQFLIATLRGHAEAEKFALTVQERISASASKISPLPISFSVGMSGGRRSFDRPSIHPESNLDDLIRLAVERCRANRLRNTPSGSVKPAPEAAKNPDDVNEKNPPVDSLETPSVDSLLNYIPKQSETHFASLSSHFDLIAVNATPKDGRTVEGKVKLQTKNLTFEAIARSEEGPARASAEATASALIQAIPVLEIDIVEVQAFRNPIGQFNTRVLAKFKYENHDLSLESTFHGAQGPEQGASLALLSAFHQLGLAVQK